VQFIRRGIAERQELNLIAENLMDNCIASPESARRDGRDNMTIIIVALPNGLTKDEWYDMVVGRVEDDDGPVAEKRFGAL